MLRLEDYFESREYFYLCFELSTALTLERYVKSQKEMIPEFRVQQIALQLAEAIDYLHDHGIILRNLQSSGIQMAIVHKDKDIEKP